MLFKDRFGAIGAAMAGEGSTLLLLFLDVLGKIAENLEMVCQLQESIYLPSNAILPHTDSPFRLSCSVCSAIRGAMILT